LSKNYEKKCKPYEDLYIYYLEGCMEHGANISDSEFIGNWEEDGFSFLFFSRPSRAKVDELLKRHPSLTLIDEYYMTYNEWQGGAIAPFRAGQFAIVPPWHRESGILHEERLILLDPCVVFGTGTHPTTSDCLEALEIVFRRGDIKSVIDLGTGTGLLALAAAALGCNKTLAVDFNLLAVKTARKNIELNGFEDRLLAVHGKAEDLIFCPADLVIANIHYDVMKHLITSEWFLQKKCLFYPVCYAVRLDMYFLYCRNILLKLSRNGNGKVSGILIWEKLVNNSRGSFYAY